MTQPTQPDPTGTVISADAQRDIRVGMNALPYAADLRVPRTPRGELSARHVVAFLDGHPMESDVAAFRRLIGTAPVEVTS